MLNIKIIVGSTREGRFSETLIPWIESTLESAEDATYEVLDLRDFELPYYNEPSSPAYVVGGAYPSAEARRWAEKINEGDAFIMITPEYNRGTSAVLKNALDSIYGEWNNKPVAFISYGSVGGARAVEQLRLNAVEMQMAPIRSGVHIFAPWTLRDEKGGLKEGALETYTKSLEGTVTQLLWWGNALKAAREAVTV